jgi:hypothetical protein
MNTAHFSKATFLFCLAIPAAGCSAEVAPVGQESAAVSADHKGSSGSSGSPVAPSIQSSLLGTFKLVSSSPVDATIPVGTLVTVAVSTAPVFGSDVPNGTPNIEVSAPIVVDGTTFTGDLGATGLAIGNQPANGSDGVFNATNTSFTYTQSGIVGVTSPYVAEPGLLVSATLTEPSPGVVQYQYTYVNVATTSVTHADLATQTYILSNE